MAKPKTSPKSKASPRKRPRATTRVPTADLESLRALVDQIGVVFHKDETPPRAFLYGYPGERLPPGTPFFDTESRPQASTYLGDYDPMDFGPVWTTATGQRVLISAMTDSHLRNTLAMLIHRAEATVGRLAHHDPCPGVYTPELRKLMLAPPIRVGDSEKWLLREVPAFAALRAEFLRRERSKT